MAFEETIRYPGQGRVDTLSGSIALEQAAGRLIIRDPNTRQPRNVQDIDGTHVYDTTGTELTRLDTDGLKVFDKDNAGKETVRGGKFPGNNGYGFAVAEPGQSIEEAIS